MYKLYFSRKDLKIELSPIKNNELMVSRVPDEIVRYNDCYYVCSDRKKLRDKANEIREKWIREVEEELGWLKDLKIKNKY